MSSGLNNAELGAITLDKNIEKIKSQILDVKKQTDIIQGSADQGWFIPPTLVLNPDLVSKLTAFKKNGCML